tara:strand:+ start:2083 stop:2460 length:378 start_codon:yes stop_codon:yes gene_type:complete
LSGLGRKVFTAGEVLAAADVNGYLMDQSVMVFANAAARTAAISSPAAGMMTFLVDVAAVNVYDGSAWVEVSGGGNEASDAIQPNFNTISENYTFTANYNGVSAGPITIASGFTVTVGATSAWSIV